MPPQSPHDDSLVKPKIEVAGITIEWDLRKGTCTLQDIPATLMWVDSTLASLMAGVQAMVGTERFALALQAEGRKSVGADWEVISRFPDFEDGFQAIAAIAAVAGWGQCRLVSLKKRKKECRFRIEDSWEGRYQRALGVCWGSCMLAGKLAGYASRLFGTNCWAEQTAFIARGDAADEFVVRASERTIEQEVEDLLITDEATRADMAIALGKLQTEIAERRRAEEALRESEEKYRALADNLPVGLFRNTPGLEGKFLFANQAIVRMFGFDSVEEFSRSSTADLYVDPKQRRAVSDRLVSDGRVTDLELRLRRKEGGHFWGSVTAHAIRGGSGKIECFEGIVEDITDRKLAEEEMVRAKEDWERTFDAVPDLIALIDTNHRVVRANKAMIDRLGLDASRVVGRTCHELVHGLSRPPAYCPHARLMRDGKEHQVDVEEPRLDGVFEETCSPIRAPEGELIGAVHVLRDVTERRRAEEEMVRERNLSRVMIDSLPGIFYLFDYEGQFLRWNKAFETVSGYSADELARQGPMHFFHGRDRKLIAERVEQALETGVAEAEAEFVSKDGRGTPHFFTGRLIEVDGRPCVIGMGIDITERKRAEGDLARAHDLFEAIFQHHPYPLLLVRRDDGLVRMVNFAFEQEWGYRQDQVAGLSARTFYADPANRDKMIARQASQGSLREFESLGRKADGSTAPVLMSVEPVDIAGEPHLIVTAQDITRRKQEEEEKDRLERQLYQAQKLEAIGRLAGGMAHDFNNLLAVIMGYSQLALERIPPEKPFRKELEAIDQASGRAASLIRQLLAFSRRQILQPKVLDLNRLVADTEQMLRRLIGEDIELVTSLEPDLGRIKADPGQIEQLIVNLAVNARDAIDGIGKVTIETASVYLDEAYQREHSDAAIGRHAMLALSDTGQGMDEDTKSKIFDPFFTTKDPDKGTGLGLATVYGIVKQSGGNIYVYSEPGQGTTFKIYLPVVEDAEAAPSPESGDETMPRGTETVLVVEDEDGVRNFILDLLRYAGYSVLEAENGQEALEVCQKTAEPIDLVITDVVMPKMSGRELSATLAELRPETRVLFMSGYTDNAIVHHGMLDQGVHFIAKPFTPAALARKIRDILDGTTG